MFLSHIIFSVTNRAQASAVKIEALAGRRCINSRCSEGEYMPAPVQLSFSNLDPSMQKQNKKTDVTN